MIKQEKKTTQKKENNGIERSEKISPICQTNCRVCSSGHIQEIHNMIKARHQYHEICAVLVEKYDFSISQSSISRHIKNYRKHVQLISTKMVNTEIVNEANKQADHTKKIVSLIDMSLSSIKSAIENNTLHIDVSDLDKLMKMRYQILSGDSGDEDEIMAIFQKSMDKYGVNQNQGVLFKRKKQIATS